MCIRDRQYAEQFNNSLDKIFHYIQSKIDIDILSKENKQKISELVGKISSTLLNTTLNTISTIAAMFFILYFMLTKARLFERILMSISPLKRSNGRKIGTKFRKLVIANAVGIPVVALGPVSYTHLDVYKRQVLFLMHLRIIKILLVTQFFLLLFLF